MRVLVTGATSMIGDFLLPMLTDAGHEVIATSRGEHEEQEKVRWIVADLGSTAWLQQVGSIDAWTHFASITLIAPILDQALALLGSPRIIVFSSTSKFTKRYARGERDRKLAEALEAGEQELLRVCTERQINWNILRPTLIYSLGRDKNITLINRFIRRFRFFPLIGTGQALRQPVHAEDLAKACLRLLENEHAVNKAYNLSGKEIISYRNMVEKLFAMQGIRPCFFRMPMMILQLVIVILRVFLRYRYLTPDMAERMTMDMVFDHTDAADDFGYNPRPFQP